MSTFKGDWESAVNLITSATITNGNESANGDINFQSLGHYVEHIQFAAVVASGSPTGDVVANVYSSVDNSNWDTEPLMSVALPIPGTGTHRKSFSIVGVRHARVRLKNSSGVSADLAATRAGFIQQST